MLASTEYAKVRLSIIDDLEALRVKVSETESRLIREADGQVEARIFVSEEGVKLDHAILDLSKSLEV